MTALQSHERFPSRADMANWINYFDPEQYDDLESCSSIVESSVADSTSLESDDEDDISIKSTADFHKLKEFSNNTVKSNINTETNLDFIQSQLEKLTTLVNSNTFDFSNISISNSSNIVVGSIININHDLTIDVIDSKNETETLTRNDIGFTILPRNYWSTRIPNEPYDIIEEPINLVIISHTATASSTDESGNIELIRDIQEYHVDTYGWNDIAYNFLIGGDGNIYEGRGWGVEGAHSFGYNNRSIGISFIGCFMKKLPTEKALRACKYLLEKALNGGHISKDYKLVGHRQCSTTESPGSKLYEEIQTWKHFYNKTIDDDLREDENQ